MDISKFFSRVDDFPFKGKTAIDISGLMSTPEVFDYSVSWLVDLVKKYNIDCIVAIETRGFIWGAPTAFAAKLPLHLARKPMRIPRPAFEKKFLTRGRPYSLSIQEDANIFGNVMVIDDIIVSSATHIAVGELLTEHFGILPVNQLHASVIQIQDNFQGTQILRDKGYLAECLITDSFI
jgi:adenine phosphoribosyltransferase